MGQAGHIVHAKSVTLVLTQKTEDGSGQISSTGNSPNQEP